MTRVTVLQFSPVLGDIEANIRQITRLLAANQGSDLYVLPELASSGFNFTDRNHAMSVAESIDDSRFIDALEELCARYQCYIASGINEREGDLLFNTAVLVSPDGLIGVYRKLHLFDREKEIFEPGDLDIPVYETSIGTIGLLICFDWMFPEVWRAMALQGVQIIAHPCCLVLPYCQRVVPSHAIINRIFVATANRVGIEGDITFNGKSVIVAPDGTIMGNGAEGEEDVITVDMDISLADNKMVTMRNHALDDRRADVYRKYIK